MKKLRLDKPIDFVIPSYGKIIAAVWENPETKDMILLLFEDFRGVRRTMNLNSDGTEMLFRLPRIHNVSEVEATDAEIHEHAQQALGDLVGLNRWLPEPKAKEKQKVTMDTPIGTRVCRKKNPTDCGVTTAKSHGFDGFLVKWDDGGKTHEKPRSLRLVEEPEKHKPVEVAEVEVTRKVPLGTRVSLKNDKEEIGTVIGETLSGRLNVRWDDGEETHEDPKSLRLVDVFEKRKRVEATGVWRYNRKKETYTIEMPKGATFIEFTAGGVIFEVDDD